MDQQDFKFPSVNLHRYKAITLKVLSLPFLRNNSITVRCLRIFFLAIKLNWVLYTVTRISRADVADDVARQVENILTVET